MSTALPGYTRWLRFTMVLVLGAASLVASPKRTGASIYNANGKIAFVRTPADDYRGEIWISDENGAQALQLVNDDDAWFNDPSWSPDGRTLAFIRGECFDFNCYDTLQTSRPDGSGLRSVKFVYGMISSPSWSPDGARLAFEYREGASNADYRGGLATMPAGGGDHRLVTRHWSDSGAAWSPRGTTIAFSRIVDPSDGGASIFTIKPSGEGRVKLTEGGYDYAPSWSPDGQWIAFIRSDFRYRRVTATHAQIMLMTVDGRGERVIYEVPTGQIPHGLAWSPDGTRILFDQMGDDYMSALYSVSPEGTSVARISPQGKDDASPSWQPTEIFESYTALGDSYSSGEGLPKFEQGTDVEGSNMCHRSINHSYSKRVARVLTVSRRFGACSGAIVSDFYTNSFNGNDGEGAQLEEVSSADDLVTLTIGGNDVEFAWVIEQCVSKRSNCSQDAAVRERVEDGLEGLRNGRERYCLEGPGLPGPACVPASPPLDQLYGDIASRAPSARIVVGTYPSLFPRNPESRCDLENVLPWVVKYPLTISEINWLNDQGVRLNKAIVDEASDARARGVNVQVANVYKAFGDHGLCTSRSWIIGARTKGFAVSPFSLHPIAKGQRAMADAFLGRL